MPLPFRPLWRQIIKKLNVSCHWNPWLRASSQARHPFTFKLQTGGRNSFSLSPTSKNGASAQIWCWLSIIKLSKMKLRNLLQKTPLHYSIANCSKLSQEILQQVYCTFETNLCNSVNLSQKLDLNLPTVDLLFFFFLHCPLFREGCGAYSRSFSQIYEFFCLSQSLFTTEKLL